MPRPRLRWAPAAPKKSCGLISVLKDRQLAAVTRTSHLGSGSFPEEGPEWPICVSALRDRLEGPEEAEEGIEGINDDGKNERKALKEIEKEKECGRRQVTLALGCTVGGGTWPGYNSLAPLHFCHLSSYRSFWLVDGPAPKQAGPVPQQLRDQDLSCSETGAWAKALQAQTGRGYLGLSF